MSDNADPMVINASPTKELFISMLVKDIPLVRAIIDLIDNAVDGARRCRPDFNYDGLWIRLEVSEQEFKVADNCGGIPLEIARHYAFRFGRPANAPTTTHSVGQFGVGMKRALFKLGTSFEVHSATEQEEFLLKVDVDQWKTEPNNWEFRLDRVETDPNSISADLKGTTIIKVKPLHPSISVEFNDTSFVARLRTEIQSAQQESMTRGLAITVNKEPLQFEPALILQSEQLKPAVRELAFNGSGQTPVTAKLYAGIGDSDPSAAGWYVLCNGRLILEADQTITTGWGEDAEITVPKYHNQFAMFRGFAYLDSDDASRLPWNTTKTGVDADSPVYRTVRSEMVSMMRPVITFLNKLDNEKSQNLDQKPLENAVMSAAKVQVSETSGDKVFKFPSEGTKAVPPKDPRISYTKPAVDVAKVKETLGASTLKEVGEATFDYYMLMECDT